MVAQGAVDLDDEQRLVGGPAAEAEGTEVVDPTEEDAVDVVEAGGAGERAAANEGGGDGVAGVCGGEIAQDLVGIRTTKTICGGLLSSCCACATWF